MGDWNLSTDPLEALRDGDAAPFEAFVRSHARLLVAWFRRQGAGLHRAEDLTQDVFLKLHKSADRYVARERFGAYVLRAARNLWIDDCRRRGVRPTTLSLQGRPEDAPTDLGSTLAGDDLPKGPSAPVEPSRAAASNEGEEAVRRAVESLSPAHREVFELAVLEGLPYPDIARILDVPVGTIKSRVYYALRKLREVLESLGFDPREDGGDALAPEGGRS